MPAALPAQVVWYVTGRFYTTPATGTQPPMAFDVGYFLNVQGIEVPLFASGTMSEATALLTFAADPFTANNVMNGGLSIGLDAVGGFSLYLLEAPGASFDDPDSFKAGTPVATFERVSMVATVSVGLAPSQVVLLSNVFTAQLTSSTPFMLGGATYDFADLVGYGITQWGTAATEPLTPPSGYSGVVPFTGSAIRVGS